MKERVLLTENKIDRSFKVFNLRLVHDNLHFEPPFVLSSSSIGTMVA